MGTLIDRTGHTYGRLRVLRRWNPHITASNGVRTKWECRCECGTSIVASGHELSCGDTRSCGCLQHESIGNVNRSHSLSRTPTYWSWQAAKERCGNPNNVHFSNYGARGIAVCPRWMDSFENFLADMGVRPKGTTLDRIDPYGQYEPSNCRWATHHEQSNNKRTNVIWKGESLTIKEVARRVGVPRPSLNKLINRGLTVDAAVAYAIASRRPLKTRASNG